MNSLLTLASTSSLLGAGTPGVSLQEQFEERIPGFGVLQNFFKTWLRLDLTTVLTVAALMGAASSGVQSLKATGYSIYWWILRFLTASISIAGNDRLNREVLNWLGSQVLGRQGSRVLTAHSETIQSDAWAFQRVNQERNDYNHEKRVPVQYLPTFGVTWFIHERNLFMVRRILTNSSHYSGASTYNGNKTPDEYSGAPQGDEPLLVMCLGRSVEPIKRFLGTCRDFADKQREAYVTVRASKQPHYDVSWDTTILRPLRPLETIHFDEKIKEELVADISSYLDSNTRKYYNGRGIPYRRGYLLHGPPGTGKTSLSLALAGMFGLELYLLHIPGVREDASLEKLFTALPPRCIVLLEDIDAVGVKRRAPKPVEDTDDEDEDEKSEDETGVPRTSCTLSGLLNVLDGVASQEGRIVLMTSNFAEKLDKALVRPGRVDRMIYLGNISQRSAELMFLRMYAPDRNGPVPSEKDFVDLPESELQALALKFSQSLPDDLFTPAQLQGYLLSYRDSPIRAVEGIEKWVKEEQATMNEAKEKAENASERKKRKRREARLKALAKAAKAAKEDDDSTEDLEALVEKLKKEKEKAKTLEKKEAKEEVTPAIDDESKTLEANGDEGKMNRDSLPAGETATEAGGSVVEATGTEKEIETQTNGVTEAST
ncbi:P-loop containing nucleoside triphosphate hydrolase protein [Podospora appendiculata]|uniref:P-loop containing nucleoside triphosphate hydrolase protein n=1 Tax=Podospora appendiculata TaxID=314037 RepID=A0AAE0WYK8_9PEZI|nr:P-loop containing nucleoside triphosphate hydrolase protein [Podospora appendiculata]